VSSVKRRLITLAIIPVLSVLLRIADALYLGDAIEEIQGGTHDQIGYDMLAQRVADGHGFTFDRQWWPQTRAGEPIAHWSNVHTLFLAGIYWMTPSISAHNQFVGLFAQVGLLGLGCYVWFLVEAAILSTRLIRRSSGFARVYALAMLGGLAGTIVADMIAATSLPFVYNVGFKGLRGSVLGWMLLGGLVVLENLSHAEAESGRL
jgi:hypothetical protein